MQMFLTDPVSKILPVFRFRRDEKAPSVCQSLYAFRIASLGLAGMHLEAELTAEGVCLKTKQHELKF